MRLTTRMLVPCINNKDSRPTLQPLISDQLYIIAPCLSNVRTNQTGKRWREGWERTILPVYILASDALNRTVTLYICHTLAMHLLHHQSWAFR